MKNLSLLIIAFAFCFSASAQTTGDTTHHRTHHQYSQTKHTEHYVMQDGKLMMDKNGTMNAVNSDVTLSNGTTITTDGKVTWKNGKTQTLQNGERISTNGKIWGNMHSSHSSTHTRSSSTHMHKMKNNADSTH
jgi:hypothetical protein